MLTNFLKFLILTALVVCCCGRSLSADPKASDDEDAIVPEGPVKAPAKPKEKLTLSAEEEEPVEPDMAGPDVPGAVQDEIDRLERAIAGMRSAQKRVAQSDSSAQTQKIQERVIKDLQDLLAFLKKQQGRQQGMPNQNQPDEKNRSQKQRQKLQKGQGNPENSGRQESPDTPDSQGGRRNDDKTSDSQESTEAARAKAADESRRAQLVKDVWGHLPPHLREAMQNAFGEKYLPRYEDLVKKYYEALAEKNRKRPPVK